MPKERMAENIERAQAAIERNREAVSRGLMRQHYHFMGQTGWINDPNGLIYFRGKYHFFYQCNPYYGFWDCMHWGHAVSSDLVHWEYLPLALAPSEPYDDHLRGGCFSGSAIEHDGKLYVMFTAMSDHGNGFQQTQCIAWSGDGIHFEKYEGNPVLTAPEGVLPSQFRDPKVWEHDGSFYMVCGAGCSGLGQALLYRSPDMLHWEYVNVLTDNHGEWGSMWECPDFFRLGDSYVLTCSPVRSGGNTAVYLVGDFDYATGKFVSRLSGAIDRGMDYYAPQTFLAPDGRRIAVAWANEWEWMPFWKDWGPTYREGWCGFFNLPREIRMMPDHTLQFVPIRELESLRTDAYREESFTVTEESRELCAGDGISFEMKLKVDLRKTNAEKLELDFRCGEGKKTVCMFDFRHGEMWVDRNESDGWSRGVSRSTLFLKGKEELDIHVFSDQSSLEIFTDQYRNNHANNIFAGNAQNWLSIRAHGGRAVIREYESFGMKECFR